HHGYGLGPTWLLLLQVPPVFSLAPPSISTLDSSQVSILRLNFLQYYLPAFMPAFCHSLSPSHFLSFVLPPKPPSLDIA
ncbi:hypothetical protein M9458_042094, partial [Cirrhinus mrigala]